MCWNGKCDVKIAKKDIIVYKVGYMSGESFCSLYLNYTYVPKETNKEVKIDPFIYNYNICKERKKQECIIYTGYHSYKEVSMPYSELGTSSRLVYLGRTVERINLFNLYYVATFIIPKGSEYYENDEGEIVSSNIIYTGKYVKL